MTGFEGIETLADVTRVRAGDRAARIALSCPGRSTTFYELDLQTNQIANALLAEGIGRGDRIAIVSRNSDDYLALVFGAAKAAACSVAVNWRLAPAEVDYIVQHSEAKLVFCEPDFAPAVEAAARASAAVRRVVQIGRELNDDQAWWGTASADDPRLAVFPDDDFVQMYTSGTTGLPKGVVLAHRQYKEAWKQLGKSSWAQWSEDEVVFPPSPFFHVSGLNLAVRSVAWGARTVIRPAFVPHEVVELIARERITRTVMVPAVVRQLILSEETRRGDFSSLKTVTYGGAPMPPEVLAEARRIFGCDFVQGYGLTESGGQGVFLSPEDHDPARGKFGSCGRAVDGVELRIVDGSGQDLPARAVGEIFMRSQALMKEYWRNPDATDETIVDGWLRTGDAGYLDEDGFLFIHDRVKDMIVSGGENIYPTEVENALSSHPAVSEIAVIGVPDETWGEAVKAIVVLKPGASATASDLIEHGRARIAGYKLPKSVDFSGEALPRNAAGKVLRRHLREPFWKGRSRQVA